MSTPWTPGPWEWDGNALKAGPDEYVLWPSNCITEPETTKEAIGACGHSAERCANANAKLMQCAPEMADLLIALNEAYESDPAELKDMAYRIRPLLKKIDAV